MLALGRRRAELASVLCDSAEGWGLVLCSLRLGQILEPLSLHFKIRRLMEGTWDVELAKDRLQNASLTLICLLLAWHSVASVHTANVQGGNLENIYNA